MRKLASAAIASYLAARFGVPFAERFLGFQEPEALLYGCGSVFLVSWYLAYVLIDRIDWQNLFVIGSTIAAVYLYAIPVGYRFTNPHDRSDAAFQGGIIVFLAAPLIALALWPLIRTIGNTVITAGLNLASFRPTRLKFRVGGGEAVPVLTYKEIEQSIAAGKQLHYESRIDRDFEYYDGAFRRTERVRSGFWLQRNSRAMNERERLALQIFETLRAHKLLNKTDIDRMQFALTWGDGRCQASGEAIRCRPAVAQQHGLRNRADFIRNEASVRDATTEGVISELFNVLVMAAMAKDPPDDIVRLSREVFPATRH